MARKKRKTGGARKNEKPAAPDHREQVAPADDADSFAGRTWPYLLGGMVVFSLVLGSLCLLQYRSSPFFDTPIIDEASFVEWARRIAYGEVVERKAFYYDPLYPYFLALIFKLGGPELVLARAVQVALGSATLPLVFFSGRKIAGPRAGLAAAAIMGLFGPLYFYEILILKASLVIFLSSLLCLAAAHAAKRPASFATWAALGAIMALLSLARGNFMLVAPLLAAMSYVAGKGLPLKTRAVVPVSVCLGAALVIAPVTIRNYAASGDLVLTTSQGGPNFYIGNNPAANGRYAVLPFVRANPLFEDKDFTSEAERRLGSELSPSEVSRYWLSEGLSWIADNPGDAAALYFRKLRLLLHDHEISDNHDFGFTRAEFVPALYAPFIGFGVLWGAAALGAYFRRKDRGALMLAAIAFPYLLSLLPFFIVSRYRMLAVPPMAVLAACFLDAAYNAARSGQWRRLVPAMAVLPLSLLVSFLPVPGTEDVPGLNHLAVADTYASQGKIDEALKWYGQALAIIPEYDLKGRALAKRRAELAGQVKLLMEEAENASSAESLAGLGKSFEELGQPRMAAETYARALDKDPGTDFAKARLAEIYCGNRELRDIDSGLRLLSELLDAHPGDPGLMTMIGHCHIRGGNQEEAEAWLGKALESGGDNEKALELMGIVESRKR